MNYSLKKQKWLNKLGTMMICYAIVSVTMLILRGWDKFDLVLFLVNILNYVGFKFTDMELYQTCLISIVIGLLSVFILPGLLIELFGIILMVYSIICLCIYYKK